MKQIWFNSSLHGLAPTTVYSDYNDRKLIAMKCFLPVFRNCFFLNGHKTLKNRTKLSPLVLWRFYADISCPNSSASLTHSHQKQLYLQLSFPVVFTEMMPMFSLNDEFWKKLFKNVDFTHSNNLVVCLVSYVKGLRWRWGVVGRMYLKIKL